MLLLTALALFLLITGAIANLMAWFLMNPIQRAFTGKSTYAVLFNVGVNLFYAGLIFTLARAAGL